MEQETRQVQRSFSLFLRSVWKYIKELVDLKEDVDRQGTIDSVRKYIPIKGYNVWILIAAAGIASIGLDTNSSAVIIGAMLISPLMSPILGIGMSIGINDRSMLSLSLQNFFIAISVSILASYLYFEFITPLGFLTSELEARTKPTILDVGVALFGGIAGIVAGSHKDKTNALPGVAIATALMPPLCTTGYGLAKSNWAVFGGAIYLFFINAFIIAATTYFIVRFLNFPLTEYVDSREKRKTNLFISAFIILISIPSIYILLNTLNKISVNNKINQFIEKEINGDQHEAFDRELEEASVDSTILKIYLGGESIVESEIPILEHKLRTYLGKDSTHVHLKLIQTGFSKDKLDRMKNEINAEVKQNMETFMQLHEEKDAQIVALQDKVKILENDSIPIEAIRKELHALYPEILSLSCANRTTVTFDSLQHKRRLPVIDLAWADSLKLNTQQVADFEKRIYSYLQVRFGYDTLVLE
ncbi:MAG: DUF389 domain-containing protein [Chitinophagales bacterium]